MSKRIIQHAAATDGIAVGTAHVVASLITITPKYWITDKEVPSEIVRFRRAIQRARRQIATIRETLCRFQGRDQTQILDSHLLLVQDDMLLTHTIQHIANQKINAEWALEKTVQTIHLAFDETRERYLKERRQDIDYVAQRLLRNLMGSAEMDLRHPPYSETILIAQDLSPAEVAALPRGRVKGFVTAVGGNTSHTAIIARSLDIPAMVGVADVTGIVREGDPVVLDGDGNRLIVRPTRAEIAGFRRRHAELIEERRALTKEARLPAVTRDGHAIAVAANIELVEEIPAALEHGAEAIGMYRTEYLYLNRTDIPSEEEHYANYRRAVELMAPRAVTIRTLDIGGDKLFAHSEYQEHTNPALGLRALRFCLKEREMFRAQLRAIYRASAHGAVRILIPLISVLDEVFELLDLLRDVREELRRRRIPFDAALPIGAMIEVPSAVLLADHLAKHFQFFSIGTNDLTQYGLAVDRTNEHVAYLFNPLNPAVLRLIRQTVLAAKRGGLPVTICGEMAAHPIAALPLLGLELDCLSVHPIAIPRLKRLLRHADRAQCVALAEQLLGMGTAGEVESAARRALERCFPNWRARDAAKGDTA
ncbi:MAG: phosphoenolpyruvate--protein phosphotransferase [Deltaproteobacteria bacterium]|nr:phosphoenolpyruvate--protein phosphotransferase [Deltaproteobacteria bacterium]